MKRPESLHMASERTEKIMQQFLEDNKLQLSIDVHNPKSSKSVMNKLAGHIHHIAAMNAKNLEDKQEIGETTTDTTATGLNIGAPTFGNKHVR